MNQTDDSQKIAEVMAIERAWVKALLEKDIPVIERILADDYTQILNNGRVIGKHEALETYRAAERYWDFAESRDHNIRIYGNTAVMVAVWHARGQNHGKKFDYAARFIAVFVNREGQWQMVADSSTPMESK